MNPKHIERVALALGLHQKKVENTWALLSEGATIPFIARYRKEATGGLDEVQIGAIQTQYQKLEELEKRREAIIKSIEEQGKMTDALKERLQNTYNIAELEDLYLPYKKKRKTRASVARENGLEPLAVAILAQTPLFSVEKKAADYVNGDTVTSIEHALAGARDIIAEQVNEAEDTRFMVRQIFQKESIITSKVVKSKIEEAQKYKDYFDYSEYLSKCPSHRLLAIRRGEEEGFLRVNIGPEDTDFVVKKIKNQYIKSSGEAAEQIGLAIEDAYDRLLAPSLETEFRAVSKDKADQEAVAVFVDNLRQLLLQAPLGPQRTLGIDPGFRTGCKVVCLDESGQLLDNTTIFPHPPQYQASEAALTLEKLINKYHIQAIAIGDATAGRETEQFCRGLKATQHLPIFMVNEAGASVYSASEIAREEFPNHDVTVRGAVSIGRRLIDPLAELVKIDPKSIGVGQYQHDVNQTLLKDNLDRTVESCVNAVGINLNTASKHLLTYVSGLGPSLAQAIVQYRQENGLFKDRKSLKKVPRLGEKAFEQCAGFLRVRESANPLDNTAVHPEAYPIVAQMAQDLGVSVSELIANAALRAQIPLQKYVSDRIGLPTLNDILKELSKPGLDPRGAAKSFQFADIHSIEDLREGLVVPGIVTNITAFGAFVDIGVKQDGLVHVSQMANRFIKNPNEVVKLRQEVTVKVIEVDLSRKRIMLSMKSV